MGAIYNGALATLVAAVTVVLLEYDPEPGLLKSANHSIIGFIWLSPRLMNTPRFESRKMDVHSFI